MSYRFAGGPVDLPIMFRRRSGFSVPAVSVCWRRSGRGSAASAGRNGAARADRRGRGGHLGHDQDHDQQQGLPARRAGRAHQLLHHLRAVADQLLAEYPGSGFDEEALFVKAEALIALKGLLDSGDVVCLGVALEVLDTPLLAAAKPGFVDRVICRQYEQHAGETLTFERAASRLWRRDTGHWCIWVCRSPWPAKAVQLPV